MLHNLLKAAQQELNLSMDGYHVAPGRSHGKETELHYQSLTEDDIPLFSQPVFVLKADPGIIETFQDTIPCPHGAGRYKICTATAHLFDNTIGQLLLEVRIDDITHPDTLLDHLDNWTTTACSQIIDILSPTETRLNTVLHRQTRRLRQQPLLRTPSRSGTFYDIQEVPHGPRRLLWVTRILNSSQLRSSQIDSWTQRKSDNPSFRTDSTSYFIHAGNSVIEGQISDAEVDQLLSALTICMYHYCIQEICNRNLGRLILETSDNPALSTSQASKINSASARLNLFKSQLHDTRLGLQGIRKSLSHAFFSAWNFGELTSSVAHKMEVLDHSVEVSNQLHQRKYNRIVEAILSVIGGTSLIGVFVSISKFTHNPERPEDSIWGLTDIVEKLSVNGTLYALIAVLAITMYLVLKKNGS
ncbi:hypothetical protein IC757_05820 [Wenzhouxiangella sp. AB-CW3]|nr:hypothetical protein IC757_05820 [Wenzhouxiangella sp. AB-CW3]